MVTRVAAALEADEWEGRKNPFTTHIWWQQVYTLFIYMLCVMGRVSDAGALPARYLPARACMSPGLSSTSHIINVQLADSNSKSSELLL